MIKIKRKENIFKAKIIGIKITTTAAASTRKKNFAVSLIF